MKFCVKHSSTLNKGSPAHCSFIFLLHVHFQFHAHLQCIWTDGPVSPSVFLLNVKSVKFVELNKACLYKLSKDRDMYVILTNTMQVDGISLCCNKTLYG